MCRIFPGVPGSSDQAQREGIYPNNRLRAFALLRLVLSVSSTIQIQPLLAETNTVEQSSFPGLLPYLFVN